ncbi:MAG: s-methyl-5-thioribose-1-phosphate isomerase [Oscillospiraceae bacterium]|nr:s-methyl-5-thioribose-1-phosphate isomerase [Oscillospiraceae bacterium]
MKSIKFENGCLYILDQRLLPRDEVWNEFSDYKRIISALKEGIVAGNAITAVCAAYGYFLAAQAYTALPADMFSASMVRTKKELFSIDPTSVYLSKCLSRMENIVIRHDWKPTVCDKLLEEALQIHFEDVDCNKKLSVFGAALLTKGAKILTFGPGGALSGGGFGTVSGILKTAFPSGRVKMVFVCETRPYFTGSRLVATELAKAQIPVTVLADGAAGRLMSLGMVDAVIVPASKITANGDVAASPGTYALACMCRQHGLPFYFAASSNVIDLAAPDGHSLPLAQTAGDDIRLCAGEQLTPEEARIYTPAFDVTPGWMINGIITEHGVLYPPYTETVRGASL